MIGQVAVVCLAVLSGCLAGPVQPALRSQRALSPDGAGRIVGGADASPGKFGWQAALLTTDNRFVCGGSIISDVWIMTAGHCIDSMWEFKVVVGSLKIPTGNESTRQEFITSKKFPHPTYDMVYLDNDIGLLKLDQQIHFSIIVRKVNLPSYSLAMEDLTGRTASISGWGITSDDTLEGSPKLKYTDLTVAPLSHCEQVFGNVMIRTKLCLSSDDGHSVCSGDSGGALVVPKDGSSSEFVQVGITSFVSDEGCSIRLPQGFTRVDTFLDFIGKTTGINVED